ncbi:hypothetical protein [Oligoflexus tunisiensis]|uniref:hypothetical protein n=1 Tax=Oligoflexus tunisiensis TaxID=708132 RepID=UPI00114D1705|nr:hypothetical protein [Oligoflexus tunisiensis]
MNTYYYWPYDEVTVELTETQDKLNLTTPWMQASLPVSASNRPAAVELVEKFGSGTLSAQDIPFITSLFEVVRLYPFCYILPTPKHGDRPETMDVPKLLDHDLVDSGPLDLLLATLQNSSPEFGPSEAEIRQLFSQLNRQEWEWDAEAALEFSILGERIHPESLFSVIRRFHLLEVMENDKGSEIFQKIESLPKSSFQVAAGLLIRQNHYVTEKCQTSLAAALDTAGQARKRVEEFMAEEKGHDRILDVALKAITDEPQSIPVTSSTQILMHLLKYVAGRNFLAFSMVIDIFERSSFQSMDPLASLLLKGGFEKAARQISRHKDINDAGGHENVGVSFLAFMAPCDKAYAREAIRLAELVSLVFNSITASVWSLYCEKSRSL